MLNYPECSPWLHPASLIAWIRGTESCFTSQCCTEIGHAFQSLWFIPSQMQIDFSLLSSYGLSMPPSFFVCLENQVLSTKVEPWGGAFCALNAGEVSKLNTFLLDLQHDATFILWTLVVACRSSCTLACGIIVPWTGIKPMSPALQGRLLTSRSIEKSLRGLSWQSLWGVLGKIDVSSRAVIILVILGNSPHIASHVVKGWLNWQICRGCFHDLSSCLQALVGLSLLQCRWKTYFTSYLEI